jgi:diguanylate cyclase (GGDEF)-like protein
MLAAVVLPVLVCAPVFYFLGIRFRELSSLNQQHAEAVAYDSLTSCLNDTLFSAMVDAHPTLTGSRRGRRQGALLVVDVDNMRTLKELAGRRAGKHALRIVAGIIRASVRSGDLVGRIGGGEFGIFLPGASTNNALQVAERIRQTVAEAQFRRPDRIGS